MTYKFTYKCRFFWKTAVVCGHRFEESMDKMILFFQDGGIEEIPGWNKCRVRLGPDWVLAVKHEMEKKAGTSIPVGG